MTYETLHLCNANDILNITLEIETYNNLISKNDAVVFYAENLNEMVSRFGIVVERHHVVCCSLCVFVGGAWNIQVHPQLEQGVGLGHFGSLPSQ